MVVTCTAASNLKKVFLACGEHTWYIDSSTRQTSFAGPLVAQHTSYGLVRSAEMVIGRPDGDAAV